MKSVEAKLTKMKKTLFIGRKIVMLSKKAFVESETIALWER